MSTTDSRGSRSSRGERVYGFTLGCPFSFYIHIYIDACTVHNAYALRSHRGNPNRGSTIDSTTTSSRGSFSLLSPLGLALRHVILHTPHR